MSSLNLESGLTTHDLKQGGIYRITNLVNGKIYIGQASSTNTLRKRRVFHSWALRNGVHDNHHLQRSYDKHGFDAFEFSVIVFCDDDELTGNEQAALDGVASERRYNMIGPVDSPNLGRRFSEDHRKKIGAANKGKKRSDETRKRMSESKKGGTHRPAAPESYERATAKKRKPIRLDFPDGTFIVFSCLRTAAEFLGCSKWTIRQSIKRGCRAKGSIASYAKENGPVSGAA